MLGTPLCSLPILLAARQAVSKLRPRMTGNLQSGAALGIVVSLISIGTLHAQPSTPTSAKTGETAESKSAAKKPAKSEAPSLKIDPLKRDDYVTTSCGCAYYAPTSKREDGPMYLWINQKGDATIKVNGVARTLKLSSEERVHVNSKPQQGKIGAGDKVLMVLKGGNTSASITQTAERNCTVGPDCSVFKWQALMNLSEFEGRKSLTTWAVCGCPGRKVFTAEQPKEEG